MHVARAIPELRHHRLLMGHEHPLAFVPTMGALHEGHLSLVKLARLRAGARGHVAVSIFVNPSQFNDRSDYEHYPRALDRDLEMLEKAGVDMVFAPIDDEMYPINEPPVVVDVPSLTWQLEGSHRPGHFRGVCIVVLKLLNLVQPDLAVFGMKDFQQLRVVEAMVKALNKAVDIVRAPTLRDPDGLAMSSRNRRLVPDQRRRALAIPAALDAAANAFARGESDPEALADIMTRTLLSSSPSEVGMEVDYAAVVDPERLEILKKVDRPALLAIAATVGGVRLIDNRLIAEGLSPFSNARAAESAM
jgi:pantoate--beta-alanine ligase